MKDLGLQPIKTWPPKRRRIASEDTAVLRELSETPHLRIDSLARQVFPIHSSTAVSSFG